jgi:hypothetical protein
MMTTNCYGVDCAGWELIHPRATVDMLGYIPNFLESGDPRSAREQFNANYVYGGWKPNAGFKKFADDTIRYPGDQPLPPVAQFKLRDERIVFYPGALLAIIQPDGGFEVARLD